jgi:hypothetical protein
MSTNSIKNSKVTVTITYGTLVVDKSTNEDGSEAKPATISTKYNERTGKPEVTHVHIPMVLIPIGKHVMNINYEALIQPIAKGEKGKFTSIQDYNVRAIAADLGLQLISYTIM